MTDFPCLVRSATTSGQVRYRLGDPLVDRYLEFVAGRARPNALQAVAFDLKTFFTVVATDPREVSPADVFEFLAHQLGHRRPRSPADTAQWTYCSLPSGKAHVHRLTRTLCPV